MTTTVTPELTKAKINQNVLHFERLMAEYRQRGFMDTKAIAVVVAEKSGAPFFQVYRGLLYMATSAKYFEMLEITLDKLKEE